MASFNYNPGEVKLIEKQGGQIEQPSYLFVGTKNIIQNKLYTGTSPTVPNPDNFINLDYFVHDRNKIYTNAKSEIFL